MNTDLAIYLTAIVFLFMGYLFATIEYRKKLRNLKRNAKKRTEEEDLFMYESGWNSALSSPHHVKKAFQFHFHNLD